MREIINYYYQLNLENIHLVKGIYHFTYQNQAYIFMEIKKNPKSIVQLVEFLKQNYPVLKFYSKLVLTKDNMPYLFIDNKIYVLLLKANLPHDQISFYDMKFLKVNINQQHQDLIRFPWQNFWMQKIDYLENMIVHTKKQLSPFLPIFYWYLGLSENAIQYVNDAISNLRKEERDRLVISHDRVFPKMSVVDFYNPLSIVIDHPSRDVSEYLKSLFYEGEYSFIEIEEYIKALNFSPLGFSLLFGRMLYPSFFFDTCDKYFQGEIEKEEIIKLGERIEEYRLFLKEMYFMIRKKCEIEMVSWIVK